MRAACPVLSGTQGTLRRQLLQGAHEGTTVSLLLLREAARILQLFSIALRRAYMRSETALRSQGGFFFFAFLKHNFPSIALDSTGGSHSYKLGPRNGGEAWGLLNCRTGSFETGGAQGWGEEGHRLAVLGRGLVIYNLRRCSRLDGTDHLILCLHEACPQDASFHHHDEGTMGSPWWHCF